MRYNCPTCVTEMKKLKPSHVRQDTRGLFIEFINSGTWENVIYGKMQKGAVMGNHYHKKTTVFFFVVEGRVKIDTIDVRNKQIDSINLKENQGVILGPFHSHAIHFLNESVFVMGKSIAYDPNNSDTFKYIVPNPL